MEVLAHFLGSARSSSEEHGLAFAAGADETAHVLDDAYDGHVGFLAEAKLLSNVSQGYLLGRGNHNSAV